MRILCFGDSNTYGFDPRGYLADRYGAKERWVDLVANQTGWELINEGVNGREIPRNPYALRILKQYSNIDCLFVMLGTNDLLQGSSAEETANRMETFLRSMIPHCRRILLITPPPMKRGAWVTTDMLVTESQYLCGRYEDLAKRLSIQNINTGGWNIELAFDGVHFTENGHRRFAKQMMEHL